LGGPAAIGQEKAVKHSVKSNTGNGSHLNPVPSPDPKNIQPAAAVAPQPNSSTPDKSKALESDDSRHLADYTLWLTFFTAMLFVVSVVQGYFLYRQVKHLGEHAEHLRKLAIAATDNAKAARDAAEASLKQAATMANAERAWIVERVTFPDRIPRRSTNWDGGTIPATLTFKNIGTQPAMLQSVHSRFHTAEQLPDEPQYRGGASSPMVTY
jgi:hypothetical protein